MRLIRETAPPEEVELHLIDLDADDTPAAEAHAILDADERARAARLRDPRDRRRFFLRRLHLRRRLAARIGCAPADMRFAHGPAGKPFVVGGGPSFSASHSHGQALIVVAGQGAVGCDIERIDPGFDWRSVLDADVLTPDEADRLAAEAPAAATALFFEMWTLKEAALKCSGHGLSAPGRTVPTQGAPDAGGGSLCATTLRLLPGYAAAVAWDTG